MYSVEPALRCRPCLALDIKRLVTAREIRTRRKSLTAFLLLASLLSISELAKTAPFFGPSTLTYRVLRLNRIGEPSAEQTGAVVLVVQPIKSNSHPNFVAVAPTYAAPDILRPSLIFSGSSNQFRSPPHID